MKLVTRNAKFKIILALLLCVTCYTLYATRAMAQQVSLSLTPPLIEAVIKPGKSILIAYNLSNLGDPSIFRVQVLPFEPLDNLGHIKIKDSFEGPVRFYLDNSDIQLDQPFFLKTRDNQQILLRIRIPEGAPEGDYYYTLLAHALPPPAADGATSSYAKGTIGSNILLTITGSGKVDIKGRIVKFEILGKKIFDSSDKIPISLIIENSGSNVIKPSGQIILKGNFGEQARYGLLSENILARTQRLIHASSSSQLEYKGKPVSYVLSGFFVGRYSLIANVNFGEGSPNIYASTSFIALPFKFGGGLIVAILIGILIARRVRNKDE